MAPINLKAYNFRQQLDFMAEKYPKKVAFIFDMNNGLEMTYSDLRDQSYTLAYNLMSIGLKKGERIAFLLPNTFELALGYYAAMLTGLVSVPFDSSYGAKQIEYMLKNTETSALVVYNCSEYESLISELLLPELKSASLDRGFKSSKFPHLKHVIVVDDHENTTNTIYSGLWSFVDLVSKRIDENPIQLPYVDPDDIFGILSTVNIVCLIFNQFINLK